MRLLRASAGFALMVLAILVCLMVVSEFFKEKTSYPDYKLQNPHAGLREYSSR